LTHSDPRVIAGPTRNPARPATPPVIAGPTRNPARPGRDMWTAPLSRPATPPAIAGLTRNPALSGQAGYKGKVTSMFPINMFSVLPQEAGRA